MFIFTGAQSRILLQDDNSCEGRCEDGKNCQIVLINFKINFVLLDFNPDAPCQCNDLCVGYGDCCMDYGDVCGVKSSDDNSCEGRCDDG